MTGGWTRREALTGIATFSGALALGGIGLSRRAAAQGQALQTLKITDNLSVISGDGGNIGLLTGADGALVVDTGFKAQSDALMRAIKDAAAAPVQMVVNTHWHADHTDGNEPLGRAGARILAHTNTRKRLSSDQVVEFLNMKSPASPKPALPVVVFDTEMTLFWNEEEIHLTHVPDAHTDTDIVLHFKNANVVHAGDLLFNGFYPFIDYSSKGWIGGMVKGADRILAMTDDRTKIIPGHGPMATRANVKEFRDMLATVQARVEKAIRAGKSADEVVAAKPTADLDAKWGKGFLDPDKFTRLVYLTITRHKA